MSRAQIRTVCFPSTLVAPVSNVCVRLRDIINSTDHKACQLVYNLVLRDVISDVVLNSQKACHVCLWVTEHQIILNVGVGDLHQKFCPRRANFGSY